MLPCSLSKYHTEQRAAFLGKKKRKKKKKATNFPEKGPLPTVNGGRVLKDTVITAIK